MVVQMAYGYVVVKVERTVVQMALLKVGIMEEKSVEQTVACEV